MTSTRTTTDWATKIVEGQKRVAALQASLANGTDEVTAAHAHGFLTAGDLGLPQVIR